jgi:hypothetical protein
MLYDPKWNDDWSLTNLISWLQEQDPKKRYRYTSCNSCLIAQYLMSRGWTAPNVGPNNAADTGGPNVKFPPHWEEISLSNDQDWTFGGALKRAMKYEAQD